MRGEAVPNLGAGALWTPGKHLVATLIQDPQGVRLLRHVQVLEERAGSHFRVLQIDSIMFNSTQSGMGVVRVSDPKEFDDKSHTGSVLLGQKERFQCIPPLSAISDSPRLIRQRGAEQTTWWLMRVPGLGSRRRRVEVCCPSQPVQSLGLRLQQENIDAD